MKEQERNLYVTAVEKGEGTEEMLDRGLLVLVFTVQDLHHVALRDRIRVRVEALRRVREGFPGKRETSMEQYLNALCVPLGSHLLKTDRANGAQIVQHLERVPLHLCIA